MRIYPALNLKNRSGRAPWALAALVVVAALAVAAPAAAQSADGIAGFSPNGDYLLEIDGEPAPEARIYAANNPPSILIVSSKFASPVLLRPQSAGVDSISVMKMAERPGGYIDLLPDAAIESHQPFTVDGLEVRFSVGDTEAVIKPKPPLTGLQEVGDLESYSPEYQRLAESYQPSGAIVANLRDQESPVTLRVFFGTWCPFCGQMVPRVMRVARELAGSNVSIEFYGLGRDFSGDAQASRFGIKSVPTGVVFIGGEEVGRITGNSWKIPELALNKIVSES